MSFDLRSGARRPDIARTGDLAQVTGKLEQMGGRCAGLGDAGSSAVG